VGRDLEISLLGGFRVEVDGRPVGPDEWRNRRAADLVKLLALAPGHRMHRERLMDALWPSLGLEAAGANLRKAVHFARRALGSDDAIETAGGSVALAEGARVDVETFERFADAGDIDAALDAYTGELLPDDPFEAWAEDGRERLAARHLDVLRAAERWDRVIELEPTDEPAYRALIERYMDAGDRTGAIRVFERLRVELNERLGVAPDPTTVALYERVLGMEGPEAPTPRERVQSLLAWGLVHRNRMELDDAERFATQARDLALEAGLAHELGDASTLLSFIAFARGRWEDMFRDEFRRTLGEEGSLAIAIYDAHLCTAEFGMYGPGGNAHAETYANELLGIAVENGSIAGEALARLLLGEIATVSGDLDRAATELEHAATLYDASGSFSGRACALEHAAEAEIVRGRLDSASELVERAHPIARGSSIPGHLVVRVYGVEIAAAEDPLDAMRVLERSERELADLHVCEPCSMRYRVNASIAASRAGALDVASRHLEDADRIAGLWQGGPWRAAVWEARGELRLAQGEPTKATALFLEAADAFEAADRPRDAERCRAAASLAVA
jgi:DNA-binding SARP family transcriptional activator